MTVHFSSRVDISARTRSPPPRPRRGGITLGKLNDSNPTRHGLAPREIPNVYEANPRGQRRHANPGRISGDAERACSRSGRLYILSFNFRSLLVAYQTAVMPVTPCSPETRLSADRIDRRPRMRRHAIEYQLHYAGVVHRARRHRGDPRLARTAIASARWCSSTPTIRPVRTSKENEREAWSPCVVNAASPSSPTRCSSTTIWNPIATNRRRPARKACSPSRSTASRRCWPPRTPGRLDSRVRPDDDVAEAQRRLDVIADDYLPMSDIIAGCIPALLDAAEAQTDRVRAKAGAWQSCRVAPHAGIR